MEQPIPQNSPLQLKRCTFRQLALAANEKVANDAEMPIETTRHYSVSSNNDRVWKVGLDVVFGKPTDGVSPYFGSVQVEGVFEINPTYPAEKMQELLAITGASILYGSVREMIASISARGPRGVFLLPSVSFYQIDRAKTLPSAKTESKNTQKAKALPRPRTKKSTA